MILLSDAKVSTRLNLLTGPSINRIQKSVNFQKTNGSGFVGPNYTFDNEKNLGLGWMVKPSLELTIGKIFGLGLNPYMHFNSLNFSYGIDFRLLIGILQPSR